MRYLKLTMNDFSKLPLNANIRCGKQPGPSGAPPGQGPVSHTGRHPPRAPRCFAQSAFQLFLLSFYHIIAKRRGDHYFHFADGETEIKRGNFEGTLRIPLGLEFQPDLPDQRKDLGTKVAGMRRAGAVRGAAAPWVNRERVPSCAPPTPAGAPRL